MTSAYKLVSEELATIDVVVEHYQAHQN